jgi:diaminopimelate decarboxylase
MIDSGNIQSFSHQRTPFYYYDLEYLKRTIEIIKRESERYGFEVHYAVKANANIRILNYISSFGFGADCVSGNEIKRAIECGFDPETIAFAGVGKRDDEIKIGLENNIFSFNVESYSELEVINDIARRSNRVARIALRINPNIDAMTHKYINTGIEISKFGINMWDMESVLELLEKSENLKLTGLHFHIGSQINSFTPFKALCVKINEIQEWFNSRNVFPEHINVGGGLGINYENPDLLPDFKNYFLLFDDLLELRNNQKVHFELGRSVVGQAGTLFSKVLYIKTGFHSNFAIIDAGMTDLIRPALYQAYHKIENLTTRSKKILKYNVVGPICESTDSFGKSIELPVTSRGDIIAIRSTGAYGHVMASGYNLRDLPPEIFSDEISEKS